MTTNLEGASSIWLYHQTLLVFYYVVRMLDQEAAVSYNLLLYFPVRKRKFNEVRFESTDNMTLNVNENSSCVKFTCIVSVQSLNNQVLIQWCQFELHDGMITSLERWDNIIETLL